MRGNAHVRNDFFRLGEVAALGRAFVRWPTLRRVFKAVEYPFDWIWLVARLLRHRPDVLHFQWVISPALDRWVWRLLKALGFPIVYTAHNIRPHGQEGRRSAPLEDLYRLADALIVHTKSSLDELQAWLPNLPGRIHVLPPGLHHQETAEVSRVEARALLGLEPAEPVILFLGAILPYKGLMLLLDAFAKVVKELPDARLLVVGRPDEDMTPYLERIKEAGLTERVTLKLEYVPSELVAASYCATDVCALPYRHISHSGALLTAFRYGVPVVATDVGGFRDGFEDGRHGLRVPLDDSMAMAQALLAILTNSTLRAEMKEKIRELCQFTYSWDRIASATIDIYRSVIRRGGR